LSLRNLAAAIDGRVTPQAIGKYERDLDMPSSSVFTALAAALSVSVDYLMREDQFELAGVEFRKQTKSSKEEATIEARTIDMAERYLVIEDLLNLGSMDWDRPRGWPFAIDDLRDAEDAAKAVREHWDLGEDPIPQLAELLEERGVKVLSMDLTGIDGLAAQVLRKGHEAAKVIVIKRETWSERKRFSLAHELGHMMFGRCSIDAEKAANRFAGAFLVPADALKSEIGAHRTAVSIGELSALKRRYGVSLQALTYRCKDLAIINSSAYAGLFKIFTERGWRKPPFQEPDSIPYENEEPSRFERLCLRAFAEGIISQTKALELLRVGPDVLEQKLNREGN
tara:strand:+ start:4912 stop:5928 length:1017 start_codon:yes stop_codon:yes gene_type:complete